MEPGSELSAPEHQAGSPSPADCARNFGGVTLEKEDTKAILDRRKQGTFKSLPLPIMEF